MKATFVDLRKKSSQILRALERNERVTLFYRGRPKAVIAPTSSGATDAGGEPAKASEHAAFGLWADRSDLKDVAAHVRRLRRARTDDL